MVEKEIIERVVNLALDKKAQDVKVLDLRKVTSITDYFIICTAESTPQIKAIYEHIEDELNKEKIRVWHKEGHTNLQWVLMDYVDFVVHIFLPEVREFYSLERLWGDAKEVEINVKTPLELIAEKKIRSVR